MPVLPNSFLSGSPSSGSSNFGTQLGQAVGTSLLGGVGLTPSGSTGRQNPADMFRYSNLITGTKERIIEMSPPAHRDWRVRVTLAPNSSYFYNDPNNKLLEPLRTEYGQSGYNAASGALGGLFGAGIGRIGVVFPYTPSISVTHTANYQPQKTVHSNYTQYFYENSEVQAISITADFTVQNVDEGQYLLATIYFFRAVTKMFFGADPNAGNPPPIVYLNGYGQYYLPNVPCVVTSFSHTMPADVDYMDIPEPSASRGFSAYDPRTQNRRLNSTRLPTTSQVTLSLQPVYSRLAQSQIFSLNDFARGALINSYGSGMPSSIFGSTQARRYGNKNLGNNGGFL